MPYDADGRERDRLGRPVPRRLNWATLNRAVPGLLGQFKPVPVGYWQRGAVTVTISCPCGEHPCTDEGQSVRCQCGRIYLLADVPYVANSPGAAVSAAVD